MKKETVIQYFTWLSWRRPWFWLVTLFLVYHLTLAVITPILIKGKLHELVVERLQLNLDIDEISINPYEFTLTINQLKISGNDLGQPLGFNQLFINLQPWDSLGESWTIKEAYLTGVYGEFNRLDAETNNFTQALNHWIASETATSESAAASSVPPLRIEDIKLQIAQLKLVDQLPKTRFETDLGPIEFQANQFSTLPNATGNQSLLLKTDTGVELRWLGNFRLAPFSSEGNVTLVGPALTTLAEYLKDDFKVAVTTSKLQTQFHYAITKPDQADLTLLLSGIDAELQDLTVNQLVDKSPLLALKHVKLSGGEIKWPEAIVQLPKLQLRDGEAWATISPQGQFNFTQIIAERSSANSEPSPWQVTNDLLSVNNLNLHYRDESIGAISQVEIENIAMDLKHLSTRAQQNVEASASFNLQGGKFESTAKFQLNPLANAEGTYKITQLPAKVAQSFVEAYVLVDITEGELAAEGKITSAEDAIKIQGSAQLNNIKVQEKNTGKTLLSWSTLKLNRIIADLKAKKINIGRMGFSEAFADFNIFTDGTHTFTRILTTPAAASQESTTADTSDDFSYLIGRIDVENASGKFTDSSLPLPFSADIAHINGTISTFDSTSHSPANVKLEGQVSEFGEMVMTGAIFPLEPTQKTRMNLSFNNIDIAELSPYAIKFAGREIAKGKMDLDLEYDINQDQMRGQNNVVLHDFALGKKVAQPGAADLPLDLAVALLKDKDGIIRADLPVQGNINDPKFDYGKTVRRAIRKLITNVAAAPFRFLAGLVGVGKNKDLGYISFFAGRTDLSPAQAEKVNQIGDALIKRPDLQIDIPGVYSASFDTNALQEEKFESRLREQLSQSQTDANIGSRKYISTLEKFYTEQGISPGLETLKNNAQATTSDEDNTDQLSYARAIKEKLVATEIITHEDLQQLANKRAQIVYDQLLKIPGVKSAQIKLVAAREGSINKDNKLKLELGANLKKAKKKKAAQASAS